MVAPTGVSMYLTKEAICVHIAAGADRHITRIRQAGLNRFRAEKQQAQDKGEDREYPHWQRDEKGPKQPTFPIRPEPFK